MPIDYGKMQNTVEQLIEILYQNSKHGSAQAEELRELRERLGIVEMEEIK